MVDGKPAAEGVAGQPTTAGQPAAAKWGPCKVVGGGDAVRLPKGAECGKLTVPVDYTKPDGAQANLALIRIPATGKEDRLAGDQPRWAGESGVNAAVSLLETFPEQVRERFDVVGFDPRGVGSSTPTLWCNSDADNDADRADPQVDYSPAGVEHIETSEKQFVQRCIDKMGKEFLANVGTASVVKDLDMLRAALGDPKLTYLGYSYGTRIGAATRSLPGQGAGDDPRRCGRPER